MKARLTKEPEQLTVSSQEISPKNFFSYLISPLKYIDYKHNNFMATGGCRQLLKNPKSAYLLISLNF
jgi:hypothetical protein